MCSNLFLLLGYSARLSARFGGAAAKLLRLPPAAGSAFLLGLLGGYPAGAQAAGTLDARGSCPERTPGAARLPSAIRRGRRSSSAYSAARSSESAAAGAFLYAVQIVSASARLPSDREKTVRARQSRREAAAAGILCRSLFRIGAPRGDERDPDLYVYHGFSVLSCYFLLAAGRFLPPEALPLVLGSLELSAGCAALADCALCASVEAVHRVGAFVLRRRKCSGAEPRRRAGARA
ncbi:MAG: hypothetical protein ACLU3I_17495 [Acutalibacteraceae bacterium]